MEQKTSKAGRVVKRIAYFILFFICLMFVLRCCLASDKSTLSALYPTDALTSAFADGESEVYTAKVFAELSDDGYLSAYAFYHNPESGEVQFTVRWNESVYDYCVLPEDFVLTFSLSNDTTGEVYPAVVLDSAERLMYSYRKLSAEGVSIAEGDEISAVMHLSDGRDSTQVLKHAEQALEVYKVKRGFAQAR